MASKQKNRKRIFDVPKEFIGTFFSHLENGALEYELIEVDEDGDLVLEIEYSESGRDEVMNLIELLDEYLEEEETEEEESEEAN